MLTLFTENNLHIQELINMGCVMKPCKGNIIATSVPSIRLSARKSICW